MQAVDHTGDLSWDSETLLLDALNRLVVVKFLRYRVAYGRAATIHSEARVLTLEPGPLALRLDRDHAALAVPSARAAARADRLAAAGSDAVIALDGVDLFRLGDMDDPLAAPFR